MASVSVAAPRISLARSILRWSRIRFLRFRLLLSATALIASPPIDLYRTSDHLHRASIEARLAELPELVRLSSLVAHDDDAIREDAVGRDVVEGAAVALGSGGPGSGPLDRHQARFPSEDADRRPDDLVGGAV